MRNIRRFRIAAVFLSLCACSDAGPELAPPPDLSAKIVRFEDCEELFELLRGELHLKIARQAHSYRETWDELRKTRPSSWPHKPPDPSELGGDAAGSAPPANYSETNTQVAGVDEPDIVKTDGEWIYLALPDGVGVYRAWPPEELEEVDFMSEDGGPESQLLLTPRHLIVIRGVIAPLDVAQMRGWFAGHAAGSGSGLWGGSGGMLPPGSFTTHTRVRVYERMMECTHQLISDRIFDGRLVQARRHDETVRLIINSLYDPFHYLETHLLRAPSPWGRFEHGPIAKRRFLRDLDEWANEASVKADALKLEDFLPHQLFLGETEGEYRVEPLACDRLLASEAEQDKRVVLNLITFHPGDADALDHLALFGGSSIVYADHERLISARRGWSRDLERDFTREQTTLQSFRLHEQSSSHEASGLIEGWLRDQFALDIHEGVLRAAVTFVEPPESEGASSERAHQLLTLIVEDGQFLPVGASAPIARGERLMSTRLLGDYGYLMTFKGVDPLFVFDLQDPANPRVLGEVEIPGFSTYMHPLSPDHLLTIGRDREEESGRDLGLALQIFDVSERSAPRPLHRLTIPHAQSRAERDHRAFAYDERLGLLAIPLYAWHAPEPFPTLSLFSISLGGGIEAAGELWHDFPPPQYIDPGFHPRGLFIEDLIYSISGAGMMVHALGDPLEEIARLAFD